MSIKARRKIDGLRSSIFWCFAIESRFKRPHIDADIRFVSYLPNSCRPDFFDLRIWHGSASRKQLDHWFRNNDPVFTSFESRDDTQTALLSTHLVPRNPNAVRLSERRLAHVIAELVGRPNVLLFWPGIAGVMRLRIEDVNHGTSIDLDRFLNAIFVKEETSTEPAHSSVTLFMPNGVSPNRQNSVRYLGLFLFRPWHLHPFGESGASQRAKHHHSRQPTTA